MSDELLRECYKLKDCLEKLNIVNELKESEFKMNNSKEVFELSNKMHNAEKSYKDLGSNSPFESDYLSNIQIAKENLYLHPLVKKYLDAYKEVKDIYDLIDSKLFGDFR